MKVLFFGTPPFAAQILEFLLNEGVEVVGVVTKPDRPKGRSGHPVPSAVKSLALQRGLPLIQPALVSAPEEVPALQAFEADLFIVVAFGEIIKEHLLQMPKLGCINVHASLLPKYRGAAPIQRAILDGEAKTGITIMHMVRKMDAGDMIKTAEVPILLNDTLPEVEVKLCQAACPCLMEVIREFQQGIIRRTPQDHEKATFAPKVELEECEIHWDRPALQIHNLIRAVTPEPAAWCWVEVRGERKRLKIYRSEWIEGQFGPPGSILSYSEEGIVVAAGTHAVRLLTVQLEGKRAMDAKEFIRGTPTLSLCAL